MRSLPLLLTGRMLPVLALATAGWAWTAGPYAPAQEPAPAKARPAKAPAPTYDKAPVPCDAIPAETVKELVPEAKTSGKELRLTDPDKRRTCSWSALDGYDYRWLNVTYEIVGTAELGKEAFAKRAATAESKVGAGDNEKVPDLGDEAALTMTLTTKDKQETREAALTVRSRNALVTITYNGSDFESRDAPKTDTIRDGALRAARDAVKALPELKQ